MRKFLNRIVKPNKRLTTAGDNISTITIPDNDFIGIPKRFRLIRGKKMPPNSKMVSRPSRWGNPKKIGDVVQGVELDRDGVIVFYEEWLDGNLFINPNFLDPLRGFNLGCPCPLNLKCHVDIIFKKMRKLYPGEFEPNIKLEENK
ncbi:MAG: DUF4326 domain-containing protein [Cocleimonas sp.]